MLLNYDFNESLINNYGYDLQLASNYFEIAVEELLSTNQYEHGDTIILDIVWPDESNVETIGSKIENYILTAFNNKIDSNKLKLKINHIVSQGKDDLLNNYICKGRYDLVLGDYNIETSSIYEYMEKFKSENTLHHSIETNLASIDNYIELIGVSFTYDALLSCLTKPTVICSDGSKAVTHDAVLVSNVIDLATKNRNIIIKYDTANIKDENGNNIINSSINSVKLKWKDAPNDGIKYEILVNDIKIDEITKTISFTIDKEICEYWQGNICFEVIFEEIVSENYKESKSVLINSSFPIIE